MQQDLDLIIGVFVVLDQQRPGNTTDSDHLSNLLMVDKLALRMMSQLVISKHSVLNSSNILLSGVRMRRKKRGVEEEELERFYKKTGTKSSHHASEQVTDEQSTHCVARCEKIGLRTRYHFRYFHPRLQSGRRHSVSSPHTISLCSG